MHQIPTVYEAQSAVHDTLQQYTASFNNALHTHCVPHSPPHPHAHTHTHMHKHTHTYTYNSLSLYQSLPSLNIHQLVSEEVSSKKKLLF